MSTKPISRRDFLKAGCLTVAAAGLSVCGVGLLVPEPTPVELQSFTYGAKNMNKHILVTYASALGSTVDVAAEIGKTLGEHGYSVDVKPINEDPN